MSMDIHGKWQKRVSGKWIDIEGQFNWLNGYRNRELFNFLIAYGNEIDEEIEKELKMLIFKNCNQTNVDEYKINGTGFGEARYLSLKELKDLLYNLANIRADDGDKLLYFIAEILPYTYIDDESEDDDYRVIYMFDW